MPELPEVESLRRELEPLLVSPPRAQPVTVKALKLHRADLRFPIPRALVREIKGARILGIRRRSKYLLIDTHQGVLLSHLGMTGSWRVDDGQRLKHDHLRLEFDDGRALIFHDPRRFGFVDWYRVDQEAKQSFLRHLGPEPLSEDFHVDALWAALRTRQGQPRKVAIKVLLMDARVVVGVGNIYASEALFRAGLRPNRRPRSLTRENLQALILAVRQVLREAIDSGGSTIRDYRGAEGRVGEFQERHFVYDRAGEACRVCKTLIKGQVMGGRSTFWCPKCQS